MILNRIADFAQTVSSTTYAMSIGSVSIGDTIIIFTHQGNGDCTSITDSLGNTYTKAFFYSWNWYEDVYVSTITVAGTSNLTATSGAAGFLTAQVWKATGMQSTPTDQSAGNNGTSTAVSVTMPIATSVVNELVFGMFFNYSAVTVTPTGGWTGHSNFNATDGGTMNVMYKGTTATGTYNPGGTYASSQGWDGVVVSFKGNGPLVTASTPTNLFFF